MMAVISSPAEYPSGVVGFTGTRNGMSEAQKETFRRFVRGCSKLHHGDCIGADADAHEIAQSLGIGVRIHPPKNEKLRAFCKGAEFVHAPKPYPVRNADIVNATQSLIACPKEYSEGTGGTWQTIRMANEQNKRVIVIWPNGATSEYSPI